MNGKSIFMAFFYNCDRLFAVGIVSLLFVSPPCLAQELRARESVEARLSNIKRRVADQTAVLDSLNTAQRELEVKLKQQQESIKTIQGQISSVVNDIEKSKKSEKELADQLVKHESRLKSTESRVRARIRALYFQGGGDPLDGLLNLKKGEDFVRDAFFFSRLTQHDRELVKGLLALRDKIAREKESVIKIIEERKLLQQTYEVQSSELQVKINAEKTTIKDYQARKLQLTKTLAGLQKEADELEAIIQSVTEESSGEESTEQREGPLIQPTPSSQIIARKGNEVISPYTNRASVSSKRGMPFRAEGLAGNMTVPVSGKVVNKFGKSKVTGFEDIIFHKGVEILGAEGAPVRTIAPGIVRFSGKMPGYGNLVIVDHGKRAYTLYGRLADYSVHVGQEVAQGDPIGFLDSVDSKGRNFYFEVRKKGVPIDPLGLFGGRYPVS